MQLKLVNTVLTRASFPVGCGIRDGCCRRYAGALAALCTRRLPKSKAKGRTGKGEGAAHASLAAPLRRWLQAILSLDRDLVRASRAPCSVAAVLTKFPWAKAQRAYNS